MIVQDLKIGYWVCTVTSFGRLTMPMYITGILNDDTVYLDFDENEGDVFEEDIKDIAPVRIDEDILNDFGFKRELNTETPTYKILDSTIESYIVATDNECTSFWLTNACNGEYTDKSIGNKTFKYIHELQEIFYQKFNKLLLINI